MESSKHEMNMAQEQEIPSALVFSMAAATKVKELIQDEGNDALMLRVLFLAEVVQDFNMGLLLMRK